MRVVVSLLSMLLMVCNFANAYSQGGTSTRNETYVCSVIGWNNAIGERQRLNIYLFRASYTEPYYVAREVDEDNKVGFLKGDVRFVSNPQYSDEYTYYAKIGFVGAYFFNTSELQEKYVKD